MTEHHKQAGWRDGEAWAPRLSALLAIVFVVPFVVGSTNFCLDDAWIHLSYAKSLRLGDGFSYNPGDLETGFSSPLWVLMLAVWPTGTDPVVPVKLLGVLLHAATAWLASVLCLDLARTRATIERPVPLLSMGLLAGALVAGHPALLQSAVSGMAVTITTCLLLGTTIAMLRGHHAPAAALAFAAVLARPEALLFIAPAAVGMAVIRKKMSPLLALALAVAALGVFMLYCQIVTGWPWPNTRYVKAAGGGFEGLGYLRAQVLPGEPWLVGLGGVVMLGLVFRSDMSETPRRWDAVVLLGAWLGAMLAVALSRPLHPGVLFFETRYFAPFAAFPPVLVALGLRDPRRWLVLVATLPVALVTGWQVRDGHEQTRAQELDIQLLHENVAKHVAATLPADAVVAVEGAGAMRYFTPRTMQIVDLIGLNDAEVAHARDDNERACVLVSRAPEFLVAPEHIARNLEAVFEMKMVAEFLDPEYAQVEERRPVRVVVLEIDGTKPRWAARCASRPL